MSPKKSILKGKHSPRSNFFLLVPTQFSMQILPFGLGVSHKNKIYPCNLALRSNFCLLAPNPILKANTPICLGGTCELWFRGEPPKFIQANPPQGSSFVCLTLFNSERKYPFLVGWTLRVLGWGWAPKKQNLTWQTHPKEQLLFFDFFFSNDNYLKINSTFLCDYSTSFETIYIETTLIKISNGFTCFLSTGTEAISE